MGSRHGGWPERPVRPTVKKLDDQETQAVVEGLTLAIGLRPVASMLVPVTAPRHDALPFALTVLFFVCAYLTLGVMYWPYMVPYSITVADAAAAEASLSFLFWGAGLFVLPVIALYTIAVYWIFRGKTR